MNAIELDMMRGMVSILNEASEAYYNTGTPIMTDEQFDMRLNDLRQLEEETGFVLANSPTHNVGAKVLTELKEVEHSHPMLSLEKCHTVEEIVKFANNKELVSSIKLDGLTCSLTYENGILVKAETRGNGYVGSDITEHVKQFKNVPLKIKKDGIYVIDGEAIITDTDFAEINKNGEYKNSRNLASGTLSVLDTSLVASRKLRFFAWDIIEGGCNSLKDNLIEAKESGFDIVPFWPVINLDQKKLQSTIDYIFDYAKEEGLPTDGIVFKFDDIEYGKSLGATSHHFRNGIAYKAKDEVYETELVDIDWTMGKTGILTPTAIFKPVEIDGTIVERASVHNVSILTSLDLHIGDIIEVYKANMIIPQVKRNVSADERMALGKESDYIAIPSTCPVCGGNTEIRQDNDSKVLICTNDNCKGKLLGKLTHFVSKNAMNIENLSESTLEKFVELGWLTKFIDIYYLDANKEEMMQLEGFGEKSITKLLNSIEKSKSTTLDRFIYSLSIPDIGRSTAKTIASRFENFHDFIIRASDFNWEELDGIGSQTAIKINEFIHNYIGEIRELAKELNFEEIKKTDVKDNLFINKNICVTGKLEHFTRDSINEKIISLGAKAINSVSSKTDFLVCNNPSNSSKYKKAVELNVKIITEDEFVNLINS